MNEITEKNAKSLQILGRFGLATIVSLAALAVGFLCLLFPPWLAVDCERTRNKIGVPASRRVEVHDQAFAGFDFVFERAKWTKTTDPINMPGLGSRFRSSEFEIFWALLVCEWVVVTMIAATCYWRVSRGLFLETSNE